MARNGIGVSVAAACGMYYFYFGGGWNMFSKLFESLVGKGMVHYFIAAAFLFLLLHFFKFARYYLILSEVHIRLGQFLRIYLYTTTINIILPLKLGELFRFYVVGKRCNSYGVALLSILTERFFDTCVIIGILLSQTLLSNTPADSLLFLFLIVVICAFMAYIMYPQAALYLNRYFVLKPPLKRDIHMLRFLSWLDGWYQKEKTIVQGKGMLVMLFSILAWIMEYLFLRILMQIINIPFTLDVFTQYISGILSAPPTFPQEILQAYILICILLFAFLYILVEVYHTIKEGRRLHE